MNRFKTTLATASCLFLMASCQWNSENKENTETSVSPTETVSKTAPVKAQPAKAKEGLTFSTYTYSEKKHIDNNTELPCCSIDINLSYPTGGNTVKTSLNQLQRIFVAALPEGMQVSSAQPVNLRGEKAGEAYPVKSGKLELDLPKYAPASFILK